jgi:hypothetical protein
MLKTERHEDRNTLRQAIRHTYVWRDGQTEIKTGGEEEIQTLIHSHMEIQAKTQTMIHADNQQADRQTDRQTGRQTGRQMIWQTDIQANFKTDRQVGRQTGRQTIW